MQITTASSLHSLAPTVRRPAITGMGHRSDEREKRGVREHTGHNEFLFGLRLLVHRQFNGEPMKGVNGYGEDGGGGGGDEERDEYGRAKFFG